MREIFDYVMSFFKSRLIPLVLVFVLLLSIIIHRLFSLQIVNGESYVSDLTDTIKKEMGVTATRGKIYDRNGVLLAYNELAYAVKISDSGTYKSKDGMSANEVKNETVNHAIDRTLTILDEKKDPYSVDFKISYIGDGQYDFNVSNAAVLRFKRDVYGKRSIEELDDTQRAATANDMMNYLCKERYGIQENEFTPEHLLEIVNLRILMSQNSYNRYLAFTISNEVSQETVAAILENSDELVGVTVEEQYVRHYVDGIYCSQVLGYTGTVSESELQALKEEDDSYEANDMVGKTGIEQSFERELAGTKGTREVYVDTVGRITEVIDETEATPGHDIYLTIDSKLQKEIYDAMEDELVSIILQYMRPGGEKFTYNSSTGAVANIYLTINEIYFALIDNNLISLKQMAEGKTATEQEVYGTFLGKQNRVMSWLSGELNGGNTAYGNLSEEQQAYEWYVYENLIADGVLNKSKIDTSNAVYSEWIDGNNVSLRMLLMEAVSQGWIDMTMLTEESYTGLEESYDLLVDYIMKAESTDTSFFKKMYKYMIDDGSVSGRQLCMLLFEQGYLNNDDEYAQVSSGAIAPYDFIRQSIQQKTITPGALALLPKSGSCVITDPRNGDVLALVSYPSYDNNRLSGSVDSEYYAKLSNDKSKPLLNWATQSQSAPGSTFKIVTSVAGLDTGVVSTDTSFYCSGTYTEVTPSPHCWKLSGHGSDNVTAAIRDSCNVYFFSVGMRLALSKNGSYNSTYGTSLLQHYAEDMGLATKAGIEIYEETPHASNVNAIASAIGQGNHQYSCLNLARYVTTIANSGVCYNLTLLDKITDTEGNVLEDHEAEVDHVSSVSPWIWSTVQQGMQMAAQTYNGFNKIGVPVAAKTGTAQERLTEPDHAVIISYAPFSEPTVAFAIMIPNAYGSVKSVEMGRKVYQIFYENYPDGTP